tara:strand:- start:1067 stop:1573 length:507 start_codon:yes stop_codon:yes gene_type:complete
MNKRYALLIVFLVFSEAMVNAQAVCGRSDDCDKQSEKQTVPEMTGVLGTGVSHDQAIKICSEKGMRLPTVRELALYAESRGAQGISETEKPRHYLIKGSDAEGNSDPFYFSYKGYEPPEGELGEYWFWTSSIPSDYTPVAYLLMGKYGDITYSVRNYFFRHIAVRCVR